MLTPYGVHFTRAANSGRYAIAVFVTSAQSGKTDNILDLIGQRLDQQPLPIIYVGPSREFNTDQFEPRLMGLLDEAATLAGKVARGKRMKKTRKIVAGVPIRLAHAGSSTALKSDPAGLAIVDEYDEMLANIKGQGDPLGLVLARGDTYADFVTVVASTPGQGSAETETDPVSGLEFWKVGDASEIESPTWRLWQQGTRHHWAWPCPHCESYFVPRLRDLQWPKGATPSQARRSAFICCPVNGCVIEDRDEGRTKRWMNDRGVMIAPGQTIDEARADENTPENTIYSSWASGLCSPFKTWGERAERYLNAVVSAEPDKVQTATNAGFGELKSPVAAGDVLDWQQFLKAARQPYRPRSLPIGILRLVMGVDVQRTGLFYVIRGFGARGTSWLVENGFLRGATDEDAVWEDLAQIMLAPVAGMQIEKVYIDSGYRPNKVNAGSEHRVYEFCRRYSFLCTPTKGRDTLGGRPYSINKIEVKPDGAKRTYSIELVHVNTDFFKGLVHSRIRTPEGAPGAFYVHAEADEDYARQLLSEARVVEPGKKPEWRPLRKDNHFFDCEALAAVAGYVLNVQSIPEGIVRQFALPEGEKASAPVDAEAGDEAPASPVPSRVADPTEALRNRFRNFGARMR